MRVPDEMRKAVVFLYGTRGGVRLPFGTAFFAAYPLPDELGSPSLLINFPARHCSNPNSD